MAQEPTYDIASFTGLLNNPDTLPVNEQNEVPAAADTAKKSDNNDPNFISLRSLVTIKDAGIIIGKGGKNVSEVREITGVKAGVSPVVEKVNERILTVSGNLDSVAKAYSSFAKYLLENASVPCYNIISSQFNFINHFTNNNNYNNNNNNNNNNDNNNNKEGPYIAIHLLINHLLLGSVIGKSGAKIKEIREASGARIVASKEMLPQSTERVIDIVGTVDAINIAIHKIGECILNDTEKLYCIPYIPTLKNNISTVYVKYRSFEQKHYNNLNYSSQHRDNHYHNDNGKSNFNSKNTNKINTGNKPKTEYDVRKINFPADMVGCIIGRGGKKITEIRQISGSKINISPIDLSKKNECKEREFTISGTSDNIDRALQLIYEQLEVEKQRRLNL